MVLIKKYQNLILITGILLISLSIKLYLQNNPVWIFYAPVGFWLMFDYFSNSMGKKTFSGLLINKRYKKFIGLYLTLFIYGLIIEFIGMIVFNLWSYKLAGYNPSIMSCFYSAIDKPYMFLGSFTYPFILAHFRELYNLLEFRLKKSTYSTILAMIIGFIIWEIPNLYSKDWVYEVNLLVVFFLDGQYL
ncbi:MAG: hypothetical protein AABW89_02035 [Nanoarchaeota archaeon]